MEKAAEKRSEFWYLAPIFLGIIGGLAAYFVLQNLDPKKAKYCLILGLAVTLLWIAAIYAPTPSIEERFGFTEEELVSKVLNYKGVDNAGWTLSEMLLVEFAEECGMQVYLDEYGFKVNSWVSDWTSEKIEMAVWFDNKANDLCAGGTFDVYVDRETGNIIGGSEYGGKQAVELLDAESERVIIGSGNNPLFIPDDISIEDLKVLVQEMLGK